MKILFEKKRDSDEDCLLLIDFALFDNKYVAKYALQSFNHVTAAISITVYEPFGAH